jgi:hypothetical protein
MASGLNALYLSGQMLGSPSCRVFLDHSDGRFTPTASASPRAAQRQEKVDVGLGVFGWLGTNWWRATGRLTSG